MQYFELFYLLIPIFFIFIILILRLYVNKTKRKLNSYFETRKLENNPSTNQVYNNELRALSLIKNEKTATIKDEAATMVWEIDKLKKTNYEKSVRGKEMLTKYQVLASNKLYLEISENEKKINQISKNFFDTVGLVLGHIKVLRGEITGYKNGLREFKNEIFKNISEESNPKSIEIILNEFQTIEIKLKDLDDLITSDQIEKAILEFGDIKKSFLELIIFTNNSTELEKFIFTKIPEYFDKLEKLFEQAKKNTHSEFSYMAFDVQMNILKNNYKSLTSSFGIKNWLNTKDLCNKMLSSLSNLNGEINGEIESYVFMMKHKDGLTEHKKNISKLYMSVKTEFIKAYQIDKIYFSQFESEITKLSNYLVEVDLSIDKIVKIEGNVDVSFSSKQFKYKTLFYQLKGFYSLYVELIKKIEIFYLEGESNLLKFERLVILKRTMNLYIKNNYILLDVEEDKKNTSIETHYQKIINIILNTPEGVNPKIVNEYQKLLVLLVDYVTTVGLKIEISKIFKKVVNLLAPKRSSDLKLNEKIILSENFYLDGNYQGALDNIIGTLDKGVN